MLKACITQLSTYNKILRKKYAKLRFTLILQVILLFVVYLGAAIFIRKYYLFILDSKEEYIPLITTISCFIALRFIYRNVLNPVISEYRKIFRAAQQISDNIVDTADWSNFRKRELQDNTRIHAITAVEEFYTIRNKRYIPFCTLRSFYPSIIRMRNVISFLIIIEILVILIITLNPNLYYSIKEWLYRFSIQ